jgi:hypothetical protein
MEDLSEKITVRHGRFHVSRGYDPSVRIPDELLKCVAFIGEVTHREGTEEYGDLHATGFLISVPCKTVIGNFVYFVTAKHVAQELADRDVYFLVNNKGGGVMRQAAAGPWIVHPTDDTADVAIMSVPIDATRADVMAIPDNQCISKKDFERDFGVGDEVVTVGLFTEAPGTSRNLPLVRHGNLAMIPTEQLQTELGYADVYLVEARSIGGLSGSPVWIRPTLLMIAKQGKDNIVPANMVGPGKLLGLMQGHWDIRESEMNEPRIIHDRQRGVNLGIAIVVPASKILETINQPELEEWRKEAEEMATTKSVPGLDSAKPRTEEPEKIFTKADFEAALKKASRKIPSKN